MDMSDMQRLQTTFLRAKTRMDAFRECSNAIAALIHDDKVRQDVLGAINKLEDMEKSTMMNYAYSIAVEITGAKDK
jgi:hypothetical protein